MKETLAWVSKNVLLPLLPFLVGVCIRYVHQGQASLAIVDPAELSFSMAMVCILANRGAGKLADKTLGDSLTSLYFVCIVLFLALFTFAAVVRLQYETSMVNEVTSLRNLIAEMINKGSSQGKQVFLPEVSFSSELIGRVQGFSTITSLIVLPLTVFFKHHYQLED